MSYAAGTWNRSQSYRCSLSGWEFQFVETGCSHAFLLKNSLSKIPTKNGAWIFSVSQFPLLITVLNVFSCRCNSGVSNTESDHFCLFAVLPFMPFWDTSLSLTISPSYLLKYYHFFLLKEKLKTSCPLKNEFIGIFPHHKQIPSKTLTTNWSWRTGGKSCSGDGKVICITPIFREG